MSAAFYDLECSPQERDTLIVLWRQDIYLFSITPFAASADASDSEFSIGTTRRFTLCMLGMWRNLNCPQCIALLSSLDERNTADANPGYLMAITTTGGVVKLLSVKNYAPQNDTFRLHNKELIPRCPHNSVFLAWNPWKRNLLAQGVDKVRHPRDPCILIWDVAKCTGSRPYQPFGPTNDLTSVGGFPIFPLSSAASSIGMDNTCLPAPSNVAQIIPIYAAKSVKKIISCPTPEMMTCDRSVCDIGLQETTSSFAWLSKSSFIAGMSGTFLKVFDLSDPSKACQITSTRAVNGLTVDPFCTNRIASFFEHQVYIWKLDNLEKPVYTFTESADVCQIKWSHSREAWLGILVADACQIKLYDTNPMYLQPMDESEQASLERIVYPSSHSTVPIVAFCWHPGASDCLITLDQDGCLDIAQLIERIAIAWSPEETFLWSRNGQWMAYGVNGLMTSEPLELNTPAMMSSQNITNPPFPTTPQTQKAGLQDQSNVFFGEDIFKTPAQKFLNLKQPLESDISSVMRKRAEMGYGLSLDPAVNVNIVNEDKELQTMWAWIKYIQYYMDDTFIRYRVSDGEPGHFSRPGGSKETGFRSRSWVRCLGAVAVLSGESTVSGAPMASEVLAYADWQGVDARLPFSRYRSPERSHVLRLCMWPLDDTEEVQRRVFESLCAGGEYERAAMMALINLKFNWALTFLNRASAAQRAKSEKPTTGWESAETPCSQDAGLVALALAGYTDARNDLWRITCANLLGRLENPYLRIMFTFLNRQGGDFEPILNNDELQLIDRVAFACLYLNDDDLVSYVRSTCTRMVRAGQLDAILLTGLASAEFISLIQHYLDRTRDVQTAAIVGLHACQVTTSNESTTSATHSATMDSGGASGRRSEISFTRPAAPEDQKARKPLGFGGRGGSNGKSVPLLIKLGGNRLAHWVQSYRELLDQWRMWFCRADFDITYKSRLISECMMHSKPAPPLVATSSRSAETNAPIGIGGTNAATPSAATNSRSADTIGQHSVLLNATTPAGMNKVRSAGLVAAANQVFIACGFCGSRIGPQTKRSTSSLGNTASPVLGIVDSTAFASTASSRNLQMHGGGGKYTICQNCRKPLPRCSICLMHLGTVAPSTMDFGMTGHAAESTLKQAAMVCVPPLTDSMTRLLQLNILGPTNQDLSSAAVADQLLKKTRPSQRATEIPSAMANWFIWCQACRHGGHASHLAEWFYGSTGATDDVDRFNQCPVSGCQCRCASLDALQPVPSASHPFRGESTSAASVVGDISSENASETDEEEQEGEEAIGLDDIVLRGAYGSWVSGASDQRQDTVEVSDSAQQFQLTPI